ncbi:MAG: class I adenylate-forming enzyme family protein, partial [Aerococcus urinaeequi]
MNLDWIKTRAITSPEKVAVIDPLKHTEFTYQDLNQRAEILARHLVEDAGVKKGDRIATFAPNDIAIIDMLLAAIKIGAVFVPLNWRLKPVEIARVVEDAGVEYILYATNHLDRLSEVPDAYIKYNVDEAEYNQMMDLSNHQPFESVSIDWQDPILLIYTSGSTGRPKGV